MKGFKTILFGLLVAILSPAVFYFEGLKETIAQCGIDPTTSEQVCGLPGWVGIAVGIIVIGLRLVTSTSAFKKQ